MSVYAAWLTWLCILCVWLAWHRGVLIWQLYRYIDQCCPLVHRNRNEVWVYMVWLLKSQLGWHEKAQLSPADQQEYGRVSENSMKYKKSCKCLWCSLHGLSVDFLWFIWFNATSITTCCLIGYGQYDGLEIHLTQQWGNHRGKIKDINRYQLGDTCSSSQFCQSI